MRIALALLLVSIPTNAAAQTALFESIQSKYQNVCEFYDGYTNEPTEPSFEDAFSHFALSDEQETTATVFNPMLVKCGDRSAQLCGTRGCDIVIEIEGQLYPFTGWTPELVTINGEAMLLVPHSGWMCNAALPNSAPCYTIAAWDEDARQLNYTTPR